MSSHLTPLQVCEALIGSIEEIPVLAGLQRKSGYRWRSASLSRDAGDMPPRVNRAVLRYAREKGIPLTAEHLICGASADEIARLVSQDEAA